MTVFRFAFLLVLAALLLWGLAVLIPVQGGLKPTMVFPVMVPTLLMNLISWNWTSRKPAGEGMVSRFLTSLVVKMILQLVLIMIFFQVQPDAGAANAMFAVICHVVGLALEVRALYRSL